MSWNQASRYFHLSSKSGWRRSSFLLLWALVLLGCGGEHHSPERVVERYAQLVSVGQMEEAKGLCTPAGVAYLDALAAVINSTEESLDSNVVKVESVGCRLGPDQQTAQCEAWLDDGYERYQETYLLQRQEKQWRIDHPPAEGVLQSTEETLPIEEANQAQ